MASNLDLGDLVRRSKDGAVTEPEIDRVAEILTEGGQPSDLYNLLYVLARANARRYEGLVASYLGHRDDPMVARLALQTLCTFWGLTSRYTDHLHRFLAGVDWDYYGDVRQVAISAAGEFLNEDSNCHLLSELLILARVENEDAVERRIAIEAIARALGQPVKETINADRGAVSWDTWASDVRKRGEIRRASECE